MKLLALLSSVPFESQTVLTALKNKRKFTIAGKTVHKGKLYGRDIVLMNTGIGKVNAAHAATCVIENFTVQGIINFGVGGAYPNSGLSVGDIAVATKEIYGDDGVAGLRQWKGMKDIGIPMVSSGKKDYFNEFLLDKTVIRKISALVMRHLSRITHMQSGSFVTVSATSGTRRRAIELEKNFRAICENMEGAAIAHVSVIYGIPFFEIRGISNIAGVRDKRKWDLKLASANCQKALVEIVSQMGC